MAKRTIASTNISIGANLSGLQRGLKIARRSLNNFGASAKRMGSSITSNVTLPFAAAGAAGVKMATDLESSFGKIENLVGITGDTLNSFKQSVKDVSATTGQSQQELSEALFTVTSAGLRGAEATEVLEASAKASAIGLGDTQQVAQALTGVLQAYAKEGLTAAKATDTLTAIVREGNLEAEALAPTLGRVVGIASQLGISFEEVGANIATFTRLGVPAEEAVVGLRGIMTTFLQPTQEAEKALGTLGISADDLRQKVGKEGLQSTLAFLMESFKGNDAALASVFGNVRALSAVLGTAGAQGETYAQVLNNIENATGIVDEGFKNVSQSSGFKFKQTLNSLRNAGIELGAALLPLVTNITQFVTKSINAFRDLSTETKTAILTLTAIVAASGPIMSGIGFIATALGALLTPTGLIIAGIMGAAYAVYKFWDVIRPALVGAINYFIDLYNESTLFRAVIVGLKYTINQTFNFFGKAINGVIQEAKNLGEILMAAFTLDWDRFTSAVSNVGSSFVDNMKAYFEEATAAGNEALGEIVTPKDKIELVTEDGLQQGIDNMIAPIKRAWDSLKGMFTFEGGPGTSGGGSNTPAAIIEDAGDASEEAEPKVNKLGLAFKNLKNNVDVVGLMVNELGTAFETVFTHQINAALGETEQSFKDMTTSVINDLKQLVIKLIAAAAAAAALVALLAMAGIGGFSIKSVKDFTTGFKSVFAGMSGIKLAKGGLAYGETLAVVGDNPNARMDPEVIAPLSKLQGMLGQSNGAVTVVGKISGQDILLSSEKANRTRSRYRGF